MRHLVCAVAFVIAPTVSTATNAHTTSPVQFTVSYSFMRFTEGEGFNLPGGWLASVDRATLPWLSLVGEVSGNYHGIFNTKIHAFQGGARVSPRHSLKVAPFGKFLVGGFNVSCCGHSETNFSVESGGGVDISVNPFASLRVAASFPMAFTPVSRVDLVRFEVGAVLRPHRRGTPNTLP